jgi:hypothetical protein
MNRAQVASARIALRYLDATEAEAHTEAADLIKRARRCLQDAQAPRLWRALELLDATDGASLAATVLLIGEARKALRDALEAAQPRPRRNPQRGAAA